MIFVRVVDSGLIVGGSIEGIGAGLYWMRRVKRYVAESGASQLCMKPGICQIFLLQNSDAARLLLCSVHDRQGKMRMECKER
jgi:hypothetical protein